MHRNAHCNTIYNSQDTEDIKMTTDKEMDKEDVAYIYIYISDVEKKNIATCSYMDRPRDYHTK